jgi:hypothetical protein
VNGSAQRISWNSPSRLLVSECMIAAGAVRAPSSRRCRFSVLHPCWCAAHVGCLCESVRACGQVAGSLGAEFGLELPYRGQKEPQFPSDEELACIPEGYPRKVAMRSYMTAGTTSLVPSPHAGLGLEAYVQVQLPPCVSTWTVSVHLVFVGDTNTAHVSSAGANTAASEAGGLLRRWVRTWSSCMRSAEYRALRADATTLV